MEDMQKRRDQLIMLANCYYQNAVGHSPSSSADFQKTCCTVEYLLDCSFTMGGILDLLVDCPAAEALTPELLPEKLWEGSLVERNHYYYHKELHITAPPPVLKKDGTIVSTPFYDEIKIRYTSEDVLKYFYKTLRIDPIYGDEKRDSAQINSLLTRFRRLKPVEPLDMILALIDEAKYRNLPVADPFGIAGSDAVMVVHDRLKRNAAQARLGKADSPLWRTSVSMAS